MSTGGFFEFRAKVTPKRRAAGTSPPTTKGGDIKPLTVSQLTTRIDQLLRDGLPTPVYVKGEIGNYSIHGPSRHHYFTLKDNSACLDCVMWGDDATRLRFEPRSGVEVLASGRVAVYAQKGKHQLYVNDLQPLGQGALELAFRQLKEKLEREGLFAADRKRPIPRYPMRILLLTSRQTAAFADMLKVLGRFPWLKLSLYHVPVQGEDAGRQIAAALRHIDQCHRRDALADVILLGRGGGSLEDLWSFNDEAVAARAIVASSIPVITGIGHEVDTSIADLVADYHAHTPTEAAQVVTQHWRGAGVAISTSAVRLIRGVWQRLTDARRQLAQVERHETFRRPLFRVQALRQSMDDRQKALALAIGERLRDQRRRLDGLARRVEEQRPSRQLARMREQLSTSERRLAAALQLRLRSSRQTIDHGAALLANWHPRHRVRLAAQHLQGTTARFCRTITDDLHRRSLRLDAMATHLDAVGPLQVLRRGYSITFRKKDKTLIRSISQIKEGDRMVTRFADGEIEWTAEDVKQLKLFQ